MNLRLKLIALADLRLEIFTKLEVDLEAQFLELLELRERMRKLADLQRTTRARRPAPGVMAAIA